MLLLDVGDQFGNAVRLARVHFANAGPVPTAYQPFGQLLRPRNAASGQHDLEALLGEAFGGRKAHSRARSDAEKCLHRPSLSMLQLSGAHRIRRRHSLGVSPVIFLKAAAKAVWEE